MHYRVKGANQDSGEEVEFLVRAGSEREARAECAKIGVVVSEIRIEQVEPPNAGRRAFRPMTRVQGHLVILGLVLLLGQPYIPTHSIEPQVQWEYAIDSPSDRSFESTMDAMGLNGWELVSARRATDQWGNATYEMIFKRRRH